MWPWRRTATGSLVRFCGYDPGSGGGLLRDVWSGSVGGTRVVDGMGYNGKSGVWEEFDAILLL